MKDVLDALSAEVWRLERWWVALPGQLTALAVLAAFVVGLALGRASTSGGSGRRLGLRPRAKQGAPVGHGRYRTNEYGEIEGG